MVIPQLNLDTRTVGDLVFTTRQVFLARTGGGTDPPRAFGIIRAAAESQRRRDASQRLQTQPLDTILAAADPRTRFEYRELKDITIKLGGFLSSPAVRLVPHHGKRLKLSGARAGFERLASAVPFLTALGAPISLA